MTTVLRRVPGVVGPATVILIAAALAWAGTVIWAQDMGVMPGTMGMTLGAFVVMWTLMMAAMMLPSAMPMISIYAATIQSSRWLRLSSFGAGYLLAWALTGIPAFLLALAVGEIAVEYPDWTTAAAVLIFAAAGIYQLTSLKHRCLRHCRTPFAHLLHYGNYHGRLRDLRAGMHHGLFCLGCCWGLMVLMIAFGVMNLLAMVVLAAVIGIEKQWRHGERFAQATGVVALGLAVAVIFFPGLAPGLDGGSMNGMDGMGM
jgi:predicted metal-binding membrane protein